MYNITNLANSGDLEGIVLFSNGITEPVGVMGLISIGLFFILLMSFTRRGFGFENSLLASSYPIFIITALLSWGGMLNMFYPLMYLAIIAFTYLYITVSK